MSLQPDQPDDPRIRPTTRWILVDDLAGSPPSWDEIRQPPPPLVRGEAAPRDLLDSANRDTTRATQDDATLRRYIILEEHRNRLEWHRMLRRLVLIAGFIALLVPGLVQMRMAGVPQDWAARIAASVFTALTGGWAVQELVHGRKGSRPTA